MNNELDLPQVTSDELDVARAAKAASPIEVKISQAIGTDLQNRAEEAVDRVTHEGTTFFKLPSGSWRGGEYGTIYPNSPLAGTLESSLAEQRAAQEQDQK